MRSLLTAFVVCEALAFHARPARAQTPAAVVANRAASDTAGIRPASVSIRRAAPCAFVDCALRLEPGPGGRRLIRGASGQVVGGFGFFHSSAVDSLLAGPDSASVSARRYNSERHTALMYSLAALTAGVAGTVYDGAVHQQIRINFIGLGAMWALTIPASRHYRRADQNLSRSVWWYNVAVADSISRR